MIAGNVGYQIHLQLYNIRIGRVRNGGYLYSEAGFAGFLLRCAHEDELLIYIYIYKEIFLFNYFKSLYYLTRLGQRNFCFNDECKITDSQNHANKHEVSDYNSEKPSILK